MPSSNFPVPEAAARMPAPDGEKERKQKLYHQNCFASKFRFAKYIRTNAQQQMLPEIAAVT